MNDPVPPPSPVPMQAGIAQLLPAIYADGIAPGVRQAGRALEAVVGLLPTLTLPLEWVNRRSRILLERNLERYVLRMATVDDAMVVQPVPEVGVPLVEALVRTSDDTLAALFVELLAKASTDGDAHKVHPAFGKVLAEISPDEARLLAVIARDVAEAEELQPQYPAVSIPGLGSVTNFDLRVQLDHEEHLMLYMENLVLLGVVSMRFDEDMLPPVAYEALNQRISGPGVRRLGLVRVTQFGRLFALASVPEHAWSMVTPRESFK